MSMWLNLVQVSPDYLNEIIRNPELLEDILFEDKSAFGDFDLNDDVFGEEYSFYVPTFEQIAESAGEAPEEYNESNVVQEDPVYKAVHGDDDNTLDEDGWGHGAISYNDPDQVAGIEMEIAAEQNYTPEELADVERPDIAIYLFYRRAAENSRAIICGIS